MGLGSEPPWITHFIRSCIGTGRSKWLWSCNHKNIRTLYLLTRAWIGVLGTGLRMLIRVELGQPGSLLRDDQLYNVIVTGHAFVIIFFMAVPILIGGLGNWLLPRILGISGIIRPRLSNLSFWFLLPALLLLISGSLVESGAGGVWVAHLPLRSNITHLGLSVDFVVFSLLLAGVSSLLGAVNFIRTFGNLRRFGIQWNRVPFFRSLILISTILLLLSLLLLAEGVEIIIGLHSLLIERNFLEVVWSIAGDSNNPNNILGFDGINGLDHRPGRNPVENGWLWYWYGPSGRENLHEFFCNHALQLVIYLEIRCTSNYGKCYFLLGYIFEFCPPHLVSRLDPEIIRLLARLMSQHLQRGSFILTFLSNGYDDLEVSRSMLTYLLDVLGVVVVEPEHCPESLYANQRPESKQAIKKLWRFIFNLIYRETDI